jgi:hypothetical protein
LFLAYALHGGKQQLWIAASCRERISLHCHALSPDSVDILSIQANGMVTQFMKRPMPVGGGAVETR